MMDSIVNHVWGDGAANSGGRAADAAQASQAGLATESAAGAIAESVAESASGMLQRYPQLTSLDGPNGLDGEERIAIYADVLAQLQQELDSSRG
jgi:hypothetical protein